MSRKPPREPARAAALLPLQVEEPEEWINQKASAQASRAAQARQASGRRRFIDPATCERDYTAAEVEFMQAMHNYKHRTGHMFPTWSAALEVMRSLGYERTIAPSVHPAEPVLGVSAAHETSEPTRAAPPPAKRRRKRKSDG